MTSKLGLDPATVREARELARKAGEPITEMAKTHTTVSVERAVLRLAGLDGADPGGMPWVNRLADAVRDSAGLEQGVALPVWHALETTAPPPCHLAEAAAAGTVAFRLPKETTHGRRSVPQPVRYPGASPPSTRSGRGGRA